MGLLRLLLLGERDEYLAVAKLSRTRGICICNQHHAPLYKNLVYLG